MRSDVTHKAYLRKSRSGIEGLDDVTEGGLPSGRPTLVCGSAGCGKTLLAVEFLVRGALEFNEPGVLLSFEETESELAENVASLGFDLNALIKDRRLVVDYIKLDPGEIEETGSYDLEGLFVRLGHAIDSIGAKRVVLDTLEVLLGGLSDTSTLRAEFRRLFGWLKEKNVTALVTAERGEGSLTRFGIEEYTSDCVILLDHRVNDQISTRRLRIVKYRGSTHGSNEFPFIITEAGISIIPITAAGLDHPASEEIVSSGVPALDSMLGPGGFFRGSSILISGTAGSGKTSLACSFATAGCGRGERVLYLSFEESKQQLIRNMRSIGVDLRRWVESGLLRIESNRATRFGLEKHLELVHKAAREFKPKLVIVDPTSNFVASGTFSEAGAMLVRVVDYLKDAEITGVFTYLHHDSKNVEREVIGTSSIIDTWLVLRQEERQYLRQGLLSVVKSRGMPHSKQVRKFELSEAGVSLGDQPHCPYIEGKSHE